MEYKKPLPKPDADMVPFWEAANRREFVLLRCQKCGVWYWPAAYCRFHENEPYMGNLKWEQASGKGKVFAFNIHHRAFHPGFKEDLPYVYAMVLLEEGPMFGTNIIGCDPKEVYVGMPVEVVFEDTGTEWQLPKCRPSTENVVSAGEGET